MSATSMDLFLQACRGRGPLRLTVDYQGQALTMERLLHQPFALVGCDPRMDLFLYHPQVSRRHAYLQMLDGKLFFVPLHSPKDVPAPEGSNGSRPPDSQQAIHIGPFRVRVVLDGEEPLSLGNLSDLELSEPEAPQIALEFVNRLPGPTAWRMTSLLALVGNSPLCRVRLVGNSVSKFHCSLVRTPLGLWVVDLFGKGGITINETPVRSARLEDGDHLQVGNFIIRPRYLDSAPPPIPVQQVGEVLLPKPAEASANSSPTLQRAPWPVAPPAGGSRDEVQVESALAVVPQLLSEGAPGNTQAIQALLLPIANQLGVMQQHMFDQFQQAMMMMFEMFGKLQREQLGVIREEMDRVHQLSREVLELQTELAKRTPVAEKARSTPAPSMPQSVPAGTAANPVSRLAHAAESKPLPLSPAQPEKDVHAWLSQRLATLQQERQGRWQRIVNFLAGKTGDKATPSAS